MFFWLKKVPVLIQDHPKLGNTEQFLKWINEVLKHRHGKMLPLQGAVVYPSLWTTDELRKVKRTNKSTLNPRRDDLPVIILRGLKRDYLLDGNRRINTWIQENSQEQHEVLLVCPVYTEATIVQERI